MSALPALIAAIRNGDRRALARAITLLESTRPDHRAEAETLIEALQPFAGGSVRIGVSGPPGAGKSTFIEAFGQAGLERGRRIAVLAVDPGSKRQGGAILGDKTRMARLTRSPAAFIRPSSAAGSEGGVARRTREAIFLCEAAGFDAVLVETVGAGQSETAVAEMVDMVILVIPPAGGDELQGLKRGIVELSDLVLINKADGELLPLARRAEAEYKSALSLLRPRSAGWHAPVRAVSALEGTGIAEVWEDVERFRAARQASGLWVRHRAEQARSALWSEIDETLIRQFRDAPRVARRLGDVEAEVVQGKKSPRAAARALIALFLGESPD